MQLTGPAMAKALEDTAFYRWYRLAALNEVGGEPDVSGALEDLHAFLAARAGRWPALLATATHDTKRGEDTRVRIDVLSELAESWSAEVDAWAGLNRHLLQEGRDGSMPDGPTQYLFYQTLVGVWPLDPSAVDASGTRRPGRPCRCLSAESRARGQGAHELDAAERALRGGAQDFRPRRARSRAERAFLDRFAGFVAGVEVAGAINGLAQTLVKLTSPGVPDIYQGTERWDQSLVDPDNRRPVDFAVRTEALDDPGDWGDLLGAWRDGRIKQRLIERTLALRKALPDLFAEGGSRRSRSREARPAESSPSPAGRAARPPSPSHRASPFPSSKAAPCPCRRRSAGPTRVWRYPGASGHGARGLPTARSRRRGVGRGAGRSPERAAGGAPDRRRGLTRPHAASWKITPIQKRRPIGPCSPRGAW